jgi:hypothetical protein
MAARDTIASDAVSAPDTRQVVRWTSVTRPFEASITTTVTGLYSPLAFRM